MGVRAEPSLIHTLPSACGLSSLQDEVRTLPGRCTQSPVGAHTPRSLGTLPRWVGGQVERRPELLLQGNSPKYTQGYFLFGKILLLNPEAPSIQGMACPLTQPTSPARPGTVPVRVLHGPTLNSPQPVPVVSLPLCPYSPPCDFKHPGLSWCCSGLVW